MTMHDELDRDLAAWFVADAAAPAPIGLLEQATATTAARRPRPAWRASLGGSRMSFGWPAMQAPIAHPTRRVALVLITLVVLAVLASAAILVASRPDHPQPAGPW